MVSERDPETQPRAPAHPPATGPIRGLLVDYGGVLTTPVAESMTHWAGQDGVDPEILRSVLAQWFGSSYGTTSQAGGETANPVHELERGEITVAEFERELAARLSAAGGKPVAPDGLVARMFAGFALEPAMHDVVGRARAAGLRTCLLSNSWGDSYSRKGWDDMFDAVVISGEVGMRKPEERIYRYALDAVGLPPHECVFVDDIRANIRAARELGMLAVHHTSPDTTAAELEAALGVALR